MVQCAVDGCSSRSDTISVSFRDKNAVHFHRFPKDHRIRKKWCEAINKSEIKNSTRVCSLHFRKQNYYSTKLGLRKLAVGSIPELKLVKGHEDETMSNAQPPEENDGYQNQCQKSSITDEPIENETADNVPRSPNIQIKEENKEDETDSSEDEELSDVETQDQNIHLANSFQQNWEEKSTDNVSESSIIKPGVQKYKVKTPLEKKLLKEVKRLKELGTQKMEAIHSLLEQNQRLLKRNSFLEKALDDTKKMAENANHIEEQESLFFKSAAVSPNLSDSDSYL